MTGPKDVVFSPEAEAQIVQLYGPSSRTLPLWAERRAPRCAVGKLKPHQRGPKALN